jgi:hypothetical protein
MITPYLTPTIISIGVGVIVGVVLFVWNIRLEIKMKRLLVGKSARTLEDTILNLKDESESLKKFQKDVEKYLEQAELRIRRSVQGVHTVRFNPFKGIGAGGNQSFATALINEEGDGVIISTLYARDRMSFYSKPVTHFTSTHELTDEEKQAIDEARARISH